MDTEWHVLQPNFASISVSIKVYLPRRGTIDYVLFNIGLPVGIPRMTNIGVLFIFNYVLSQIATEP